MSSLTGEELSDGRPELATFNTELNGLGFTHPIFGDDPDQGLCWSLDLGVNIDDDRDLVIEVDSTPWEPINGHLVITGAQVVQDILVAVTDRWAKQLEYPWNILFEPGADYLILYFDEQKDVAQKNRGVLYKDLMALIKVLVAVSTSNIFLAQATVVRRVYQNRIHLAANIMWQKISNNNSQV